MSFICLAFDGRVDFAAFFVFCTRRSTAINTESKEATLLLSSNVNTKVIVVLLMELFLKESEVISSNNQTDVNQLE